MPGSAELNPTDLSADRQPCGTAQNQTVRLAGQILVLLSSFRFVVYVLICPTGYYRQVMKTVLGRKAITESEVATFLLFFSDFATFLLFFGLSDLIVILKIGFWLLALLFSYPAFCADDFTGTGI
jgi:hypothetical protein